MAEFLDNPAGRLQHWVRQFQAVPNSDTAISEALARMIGVDHGTIRGRVDAIRFAMRLPELGDDVRAEAVLLPEHVDADVLLEDFDQFDGMFDHMTLARQVRVADMLAQVDAAGHRSLDLLSRQLHRYRPEPTLNEDVRTSVVESLGLLREQVVEDATLDADLRDFILARFGEIERVLREATVTGAKPVEMVTDSIIGSIKREPTMWQRIAESAVSETVAGIVVALFLTLVSPPAPDALPPGTPEPVINNYVQVYDHLPQGGVTPEVIQGVVVPHDEDTKGLPATAEGHRDAERPESE